MRNVELESNISSLFIPLSSSFANSKTVMYLFKAEKNPCKPLAMQKEVYKEVTIHPVIMT